MKETSPSKDTLSRSSTKVNSNDASPDGSDSNPANPIAILRALRAHPRWAQITPSSLTWEVDASLIQIEVELEAGQFERAVEHASYILLKLEKSLQYGC